MSTNGLQRTVHFRTCQLTCWANLVFILIIRLWPLVWAQRVCTFIQRAIQHCSWTWSQGWGVWGQMKHRREFLKLECLWERMRQSTGMGIWRLCKSVPGVLELSKSLAIQPLPCPAYNMKKHWVNKQINTKASLYLVWLSGVWRQHLGGKLWKCVLPPMKWWLIWGWTAEETNVKDHFFSSA